MGVVPSNTPRNGGQITLLDVQLPIITPFHRPSTLSGLVNGKLPASVLVQVGPSGFLEANAARAFKALAAEMKAELGYDLTYTYGGCYRPFEDQLSLFNLRYTASFDSRFNTTSDQRTYNGTRYYKRRGVAAAASPGTSNHGWALAIDTALGSGPSTAASIEPAVAWMVANVGRFGFSYELQSEPWHIRYVAGDTIPQAVLDFEGDEASVGLPTYDPINGNYSLWPLNPNKPNVSLQASGRTVNGQGGHVVYLQDVLRYEVGQRYVASDGVFGPATQRAVSSMQRFVGITVDGKVGPITWKAIDEFAATAKGRR